MLSDKYTFDLNVWLRRFPWRERNADVTISGVGPEWHLFLDENGTVVPRIQLYR